MMKYNEIFQSWGLLFFFLLNKSDSFTKSFQIKKLLSKPISRTLSVIIIIIIIIIDSAKTKKNYWIQNKSTFEKETHGSREKKKIN